MSAPISRRGGGRNDHPLSAPRVARLLALALRVPATVLHDRDASVGFGRLPLFAAQ